MTRPTAEYFGLHPMPLAEYRERYVAVIGYMMEVACDMARPPYAVHYDGVFVGACGAIAVPSEGLVVFSVGANDKPSPGTRKDCAEWKPMRHADALAHRYGAVMVPDLCVASPIGTDRIREISGRDAETLCPCHDCLLRLSDHHAILPGTNIHMRRMNGRQSVDKTSTIAALLPILDEVARPATSDELARAPGMRAAI